MTSQRFAAAYRTTAVLVLNFLLLFLALNILLGVIYAIRDRSAGTRLGPTVKRYGLEYVSRAYPGWRKEDVAELLAETHRSNRLEFELHTMLRPAPVKGRFVTIDAAGFRRVAQQCAWPPPQNAITVFVLGGSTAFGTGVSDGESMPSLLQEHLRQRAGGSVCVYNFARPGYNARQERILFEQLATEGYRPAIAIFVDGVNELRGDDLSPAMRKLIGRRHWAPAALDSLRAMPLGRAAEALRRRASPAQFPYPDARVAVQRWIENARLTRAVATASGSRALFVWQPIPTWGYDLRHHLFAATIPKNWPGKEAWQFLDSLRAGKPLGEDLLWLGDMQRGVNRNLYVDELHYSAEMNDRIAREIANALCVRGDLRCVR